MTCTWEADPACLGDSWTALTDEQRERSLMLATSSLQMLTNYRVGTCPITIRPCPTERHRCGCDWNPHIRNGVWVNDCDHRTECAPLAEVNIPGPVGYIESMMINGEPVDLWNGDWRLDNGHLLVWQGEGTSPLLDTQDLNKPDTAPGTWSITYSRSYPVNREAKIAVAYLAAEFAKACLPNKKCSLPRGVTNVARAGVSFTIEAGLYPNGLTGIDYVDAFILKWNPAGSPKQPATVFDPSKSAPRRTSGVPLRGPSGSL